MIRLPKIPLLIAVWSVVGILGAVLLFSEIAIRARALGSMIEALSRIELVRGFAADATATQGEER